MKGFRKFARTGKNVISMPESGTQRTARSSTQRSSKHSSSQIGTVEDRTTQESETADVELSHEVESKKASSQPSPESKKASSSQPSPESKKASSSQPSKESKEALPSQPSPDEPAKRAVERFAKKERAVEKPTKKALAVEKKERSRSGQVEGKPAKEKPEGGKGKKIKGDIDILSFGALEDTQELPDFADGPPISEGKIPKDLEAEILGLRKLRLYPTEPSSSVNRSGPEQPKNVFVKRKISSAEKISLVKAVPVPAHEETEEPPQQHFFPSCAQFTLLRMLAFVLLFCAWFIVLAFPCLRFTYHVPVLLKGEMHPVRVTVPLKDTCRLWPQWWGEQQAFVERIIRATHYFSALKKATAYGKPYEIFEHDEVGKILKPYNGQIFVIFGCVLLAFPILLLLMLLRCMSKQEDLMEEAMFDLVEISIFSVFAVIEFYMASGTEIRAVMDSLCVSYLERTIMVKGFLKEKVYNICNDVEVEAYGFLASGAIFLFLVFLFAVDLIILLKNAEQVESQKYLQMAACLHYGKPAMEHMSESVKEVAFVESRVERACVRNAPES